MPKPRPMTESWRRFFGFNVKGVGEGETVDEAAHKSDGRRDVTAGGEDECEEEDVLR